MKWPSFALCLAILSTLLAAQDTRRILSNTDVMNMAKSGMGNKTIVLAIQQSPFRWTHILNAMLVEASDGNAYIIACDRAWRWSKCTGLKPGDVFNARRADKGFVVQSFNTKQQEKEATYTVLQAKSLK